MSDRSEEVTENRSTEELLEETEQILSGGDPSGGGTGPSTDDTAEPSPVEDDQSGSWWRSSSSESSTDSSEAHSSSTSRLSISRYFSPKAFLALVGAIGLGLVAGSFLLPFGGRPAGMFAVAFLLGLVTTDRRYLEIALAGTSVGAASALLANPILTAAGSGTTVIAIGVAAGLVTSVGGYYFGRDLRDGLSREID